MNILLINHYSGSPSLGMEYRPYYMAEKWLEMGHNVLILAASNSHLRINNIEISKDMDIKEIDGINYCVIKTTPYTINNSKRYKNTSEFISKGIFYSKEIYNFLKPDIIICSSTYPFDYLIAKSVQRNGKCKIIFELHDIWPLSPMELYGYKKNHPLIKSIKFMEHIALQNSDMVVSVLSNSDKYIIENNLKLKRYIHIPNGIKIPLEDTLNNNFQYEFVKSIKERSKFIAMYCGGFAKGNAVDEFIKCAKLCPKVQFITIGNGPEKVELKRFVKTNHIFNIHLLEGVTRAELLPIMKMADCLYLGTRKSVLYKYGVAMNKLFDYMLVGKPIIFGVDSPRNPVELSHCGIVIPPQNVKAISTAIMRLMSMSIHDREKLGERGIKYVKDNHDYNKLAEKFITEMENLNEN